MTDALHALLDTNTLIHFQQPSDLDWCGLTGRQAVVLVITPVLLRELDKIKTFGATRKLKTKASNVLKWVENAIDGEIHPPLKPGVSIGFVDREPMVDFTALGLDRQQSDDYLLASLLAYSEAAAPSKTIVSNDVGMRLKLRSRGYAPVRLPETLRLPDEPDPIERDRDELRRELAKHQNRIPKVGLSLSNEREIVSHRSVTLGATRHFAVKLWLFNDGTQPATDAYATLYLPDSVFAMLPGDLPMFPKVPFPSHPSLIDNSAASNSQILTPITHVRSFNNDGRPMLPRRGVVTFEVSSLTHGLRFSLYQFYLRFLGDEAPASFGVDYTIVCNETITKTTGRLSFVITHAGAD